MSEKRKADNLAPSDETFPKRQEIYNITMEKTTDHADEHKAHGNARNGREEILVPLVDTTGGSDAQQDYRLPKDNRGTPTRAPTNNPGTTSSPVPKKKQKHRVEAHHSVLPLSMQIMKPFAYSANCLNCAPGIGDGGQMPARTATLYDVGHRQHPTSTPSFIGMHGEVVEQQYCSPVFEEVDESEFYSSATTATAADMDIDLGMNRIPSASTNGSAGSGANQLRNRFRRKNKIRRTPDNEANRKSHLESIRPSPRDYTLTILQEYIGATQMYGCQNVNSGVLTALRFSLPTLRVSGSFHDSDMLALSEILFRHCNGALKHIRRLDFSIAGRFGKLHGRRGFGSHGAFTLSRVLCISRYIEEVFVQRNIIGPYGCAAIFAAVSKNATMKNVSMRRCGIGEKGALAFVEHIGKSKICSLRDVDLSVNGIGFNGSMKIEEMSIQLEDEGRPIDIDIEGNMVIQEIMNGVTHGLGIILCCIGFVLMNNKVMHEDLNKRISCGVYSISLLVLYISSTLYHSFFALTYTRYIFEIFDHCAIYILITGSYTPFLRIVLHNKPLGSFYLLIFIYSCCFGGLFVEAFHNTWVHKPKFSLAMYLGMGWSCVICLSDMMEVLPKEAINLVILGGVGYTSGVPFFLRNNNLDHSIWHCFVMMGSMCHWFCVYLYVATM